MSIKGILVHVGSSPGSSNRLALAASLARRSDAYVIGAGAPESPFAENSFQALLRNTGLAGEWRSIVGPPERFVIRQARGGDLVVIGQRDPDDPEGLDTPEDVILGAGCPVLVIPRTGWFERVGDAALIGWNRSREAARAMHDALPLLDRTAAVTVLTIDPGPDEDWGIEHVVGHLARHGLTVRSETFATERLDPPDALRSRAVHLGADLIVMGAYGRPRLREVLLGGTTQDMLENMSVPVLMAH